MKKVQATKRLLTAEAPSDPILYDYWYRVNMNSFENIVEGFIDFLELDKDKIAESSDNPYTAKQRIENAVYLLNYVLYFCNRAGDVLIALKDGARGTPNLMSIWNSNLPNEANLNKEFTKALKEEIRDISKDLEKGISSLHGMGKITSVALKLAKCIPAWNHGRK